MWEDYVINVGPEFCRFWDSFLAESRRVLYVLGQGFDPRMCCGLEEVAKVRHASRVDCRVLEYPEGEGSPSRRYRHLVEANVNRLKTAMTLTGGVLTPQTVPMYSSDADSRPIGGVSAATAFSDVSCFSDYTDVILDISALPRLIVFPLLAKLLTILQSAGAPNLHVVAAEDVAVDAAIREEGIAEEAEYVTGFGAMVEMQSTRDLPKLWFPVLGENQLPQLKKIRQLISPVDEVCPVIPFPTRELRRGDDLFLGECLDFFFTESRVDPGNVLYVHESNPFQVHRQLTAAVERFSRTFESLGGCRTVFSALSSKVLGLGAVLAAWDLKRCGRLVGMAHVQTKGYSIDESVVAAPELVHLWLAGECYAAES